MTINLFQTPEYKALMQKYIEETIVYLFEKDQPFAIACDLRYVSFDPQLPGHITEGFNETILFVLSGYTFENAHIDKGKLIFEAGFGEENFGSVVTMPLLAIKQLFVGENPVVLNYAHPAPPKEVGAKNSMEALLNNPENKKLLKKRKR